MSCPACTDPDGEPCHPIYGLAPHVHAWDGLTITDTQMLPREEWPVLHGRYRILYFSDAPARGVGGLLPGQDVATCYCRAS